MLDRIVEQGGHLKELIDDLIDSTRIEFGTLRVQREPVDVEVAVRRTAEAFSEHAERLQVRVSGPLPPALGNEIRVEQVLANLVGDAVKHSRPGGPIDVTADADAAEVVLAVADTGPGIDPELLPDLFEPFIQGPDDAGREGGLGLGLYIVRGLVEAMRGTVRVVSGPAGTRFEVRLQRADASPITEPAAAGDGQTASSQPCSSAGSGRACGPPAGPRGSLRRVVVLEVLLWVVAGADRVDARRLPAPRRRSGARRAPARARRRRAAAGRARHHRPQRGGRDRSQAGERAGARLPARAAAHRRDVRRLQRRHRRHRALLRRPRRRARRRAARRQGQRAEHGRARRSATTIDVVAFSDANSTWAPDALRRLVRPFADPDVAYVCGRLALRRADGTNQEGAYWRYEVCAARPRVAPSARSPAATARSTRCGASATRRSTRASGHDLSFPYLMVKRGRRAVYVSDAVAAEKPSTDLEDEFRRKVRMFGHCWLLVFHGRMFSLRRMGLALLAADGLAPPAALRRAASCTSCCSRPRSCWRCTEGGIYWWVLGAQGLFALLRAALDRAARARALLALPHYYLLVTWATRGGPAR